MVADKREFVRLDVGYLDNPKIADALDASPLAVLAHIASMTYCRQHRTDGEFAIRRILRKVGASADDGRVLVELGLWIQLGDGRAALHDYLKHQESAEQIARLSEAGRKGAAGRWAEKRNADGNADRTGKGPERSDLQGSSNGNADGIPNGNADRYAEERRGEERRADSPRAEIPDRPDMNPDAILQSHGMPEAERPVFKAWLRQDRSVRSLAPWLTKVQAAGEVPELIQEWRVATKPKKVHPTRDPKSPSYNQEWMYNQ